MSQRQKSVTLPPSHGSIVQHDDEENGDDTFRLTVNPVVLWLMLILSLVDSALRIVCEYNKMIRDTHTRTYTHIHNTTQPPIPSSSRVYSVMCG